MRESQIEDDEIRMVYRIAKNVNRIIENKSNILFKRYKQIANQLKIVDGILYREYALRLGDKPLLYVIVPLNLISEFLKYSYDCSISAHGSYEKKLELIRNKYY